jgi:nucleotide-binding universal stress UspA family protein
MTLGGAWVANTSAHIGLLHVIPIKSTGYAWDIKPGVNSKSPSGKEKGTHDLILEQAKRQLHQAGVKNEIDPRIRQGLVVDEVLAELSEGKYGLLVVGAHYQPGQDLWKGTLFDDITEQLLKRSNCSVLII